MDFVAIWASIMVYVLFAGLAAGIFAEKYNDERFLFAVVFWPLSFVTFCAIGGYKFFKSEFKSQSNQRLANLSKAFNFKADKSS